MEGRSSILRVRFSFECSCSFFRHLVTCWGRGRREDEVKHLRSDEDSFYIAPAIGHRLVAMATAIVMARYMPVAIATDSHELERSCCPMNADACWVISMRGESDGDQVRESQGYIRRTCLAVLCLALVPSGFPCTDNWI